MKLYYILLVLRLCFTFQAYELETVYIVPESLPNHNCDGELCITLSEFATSINVSTAKQQLTLNFMPGYHTLDVDIFILFNVTELSMILSDDYLSSEASIACQHNSTINFENISRVMIRNLTFTGCVIKILSCGRLSVENSTFLGRNRSGTALEVIKTSAFIQNGSFVSNRVGNYRGPIKDPFNSSVPIFAYIGGAVISNQSDIIIVNSSFKGNRAEVGGAICSMANSNVTITNSVLGNNSVNKFHTLALSYAYGGALFCENSTITLIKCELHDNHAEYGGVIFINSGILNASLSKFCHSRAENAGVAVAYDHSNVSISNCKFQKNTAALTFRNHHSGVIATYASIVNVSRSVFDSSKAYTGGVMSLLDPPSTVIIYQSKFKNNYAVFGGVLSVSSEDSSVKIINSFFDNNTGSTQGGVLDSQASNVTFIKCNFSNNCANTFSGGAICVSDMKSLTIKASQFIYNSAVNYVGGAIHLQGTHLTLENTSLIANKARYGGAIYLSERSFVNFNDKCYLANNTADDGGGAIFAFDSTLQIYEYLEITSNTANLSGGGAMLSHCKIICQYNGTLMITKNRALKDGGGIYASNSYISVLFDRGSQQKSAVKFTENIAERWGGGIFLLMASSILIEKKGDYKETSTLAENILYFISNSAHFGGAIYVADETNYGMCSTFNFTSDCFIQVLSPSDTKNNKYNIVSIEFEHNRAESSGSILFGGLLDRCTLKRDSEFLKQMGYDIYGPLYVVPKVYAFTYFQNISNIGHDENSDMPWIIGSLPVRVCFCQPGNKPNCSYKPDTLRIKKGETFNISLVAVDQANHTLGDTIIYSSLSYAESGLGEGQVIQTAKSYCTPLNFTIYSPHDDETLIFYPEGPCRNASKSLSNISVEFSKCTCPVGFQVLMSEKTNCTCKCDSRLLQSCITGCNARNRTLVREKNCWITLLNNSHHDNGGVYLTYSDCPSDYCNLKHHINLNTISGSDVQCVHYRTGTLCGLCKPGLSLSLGSSRCVPCSRNWPIKLVLILFAAFISGIAFVTTIMLLNLTVAIGTLNGLIFYANIIDSNKSIFCTPSCLAYYILISWLNLDIGFNVCFYKGLDTYWKTWLQLVFPIYMILLVVAIIILSRYSIRFSMLIAKKNPVATLTTLILLSYTKLLRTAIVVLLKAKLRYSDGTHDLSVWLLDPTVKYGTGKHIPLFVVAILILVVGVAYTFLLLSWQWLLKCVKYQTLYHFIDPYHAPYMFKHRYWTGLLLLARVAIYIVIILYGHGDPNTNLLAIISIVSFLLFLKGHVVHHLYKDWKTDIIETVCYLNIVLFSAIKMVILNTSHQRIYHDIATNISGLTVLLLLTYVLIRQFLSEIGDQCWTKLKQRLRCKIRTDGDVGSHNNHNTADSGRIENQQNQPKPTSSVIEGHPISEKSHLNNITDASAANIEVSDDDNDDDCSFASADSTAPLLGMEA